VRLRCVSPGQINALIPFGLGSGFYRLTVITPAGTSADYEIQLSTFAPAIYTQNSAGTGAALVFDPAFNVVSQVSTGPLVLYASGLGPTNPAGTDAGGNSTEPLNRTIYIPQVRIGGVPAQVGFSGLAPGLPGIYQLNVTPSATAAPADNTLSLKVLFASSTTVPAAITTLPIRGGLNTANVTGTITPTYPVNSTILGYSPLLTAASFNAAFDVLPSAKRFDLVASCPGSRLTVRFNPCAGTWQATGNVAPAAERTGDFSGATNAQGSLIVILDFMNDNRPFVGNFIPRSRLDPVAVQAMSAIPLPDSAVPSNFVAQGAIPAGGHFVIDSAHNSSLTNFGDFVYVSAPGSSGQGMRTNACSLTVDGLLVSSSMVRFQ
jgi:uncharacterized protein (TIGR03437 family)